ncbi:MAG: hypothetical protein ACREU2_16070 [Steroidobacteraceae bacterium]
MSVAIHHERLAANRGRFTESWTFTVLAPQDGHELRGTLGQSIRRAIQSA